MAIHHSQIKKAEKAGYTLTEKGDQVVAFWPKRGLAITGASTADAMAQMQAAMAIVGGDDYRIASDTTEPRLVFVESITGGGLRLVGSPMPPVAAHTLIFGGKAEWEDPVEVTGDLETPEAPEDGDAPLSDALIADGGSPSTTATVVERINGVAIDGAVAFAEGTPAGDCPYSSEGGDFEENEDGDPEYNNFIRWNEEWDAAADAKSDEEEEGKGGSVVSAKYRAKYAEAGHPTHCGDWLAETLNEICLNKEGVNLELFEGICSLNGVDTSKYKRSGVGWQGRIRMTGRNLMSKRVFLNEGKLILPESMGGFKQAPEEWMAQQRFKALPKAEQK